MADQAQTEQRTITVEIKHRFTGDVLFAAQIPSAAPSGLQMRAAPRSLPSKRGPR